MEGITDPCSKKALELFAKLENAGLNYEEALFYFQVQSIAQRANVIGELREGELASTVADFQRILERILARPGLRVLGHKVNQ